MIAVEDWLKAGVMKEVNMKEKAEKTKHKFIEWGLIKDCKGGFLPESLYLKMLEHLKRETNASLSIKRAYPSERVMHQSLKLYFILSQCSEESHKALNFIKKQRDRPATLLQATVNTLKENSFQHSSTRDHFKDFYSLLETEVELEHGKILMALGSLEQLTTILKNDLPYLDKYKTEVLDCQEVGDTP